MLAMQKFAFSPLHLAASLNLVEVMQAACCITMQTLMLGTPW